MSRAAGALGFQRLGTFVWPLSAIPSASALTTANHTVEPCLARGSLFSE
jgi:hypothetical protein